jgi:hypothetical protein
MANEMFRVLQDVDRIFSDMERGRDAINVEGIKARHDLQLRLADEIKGLVNLAGEAVLTSKTKGIISNPRHSRRCAQRWRRLF